MSIQERTIHHDIPGDKSSSCPVINEDSKYYDPIENDQYENEQSKDTKCLKPESNRINNGITTNLAINNVNTSDKLPSLDTNESLLRRKSPTFDQHDKSSDHSSRSPHHNHSSDRKRRRPSSPSKANESSNELISSTKYRKTSRNDERTNSRSHHHSHHHHHRHRSSSLSPSRSTSRRSSDLKTDRPSTSDIRHSSKRDDYRSNSSRNYHSASKSSSSSRDHANNDRRSNLSSPSRIPSSTHPNDSSVHRQTSKEDRNRVYNRLKNVHVNENTNASLSPSNHSNKTPTLSTNFINTNGGSQRARSNLIEIVTSEVTPISSVRSSSPTQVKLDSTKSLSASTPIIESTITAVNSSKANSVSKTNGNTTGDVIMEEMLLEEEQEQNPVKSIDLESVIIPGNSTQKPDKKTEVLPVISTTLVASQAAITPSLTPSPVKKPYTLYKVPHTNHTTPPRSSRHKKQTISTTQSNNITKSSNDDNLQPTLLDQRISNIFGEQSAISVEGQPIENRLNPTIQTPTSSEKSTDSPQDIKPFIQTMAKKEPTIESRSLTLKHSISEEKRSISSKHYTTEWLATQKPEEAIPEEPSTFPPLIALPTLVSTQSSMTHSKASNPGTNEETSMLGKLSEKMSKIIQKKIDGTLPTTNEADDAVPMSAKHLERLERRKQREKRQSEIAKIAKEALKPAFKRQTITKEQYKEIMKKVVTKATNANEVDRTRISKMINGYVEKYRQLSHSKIANNSNGKLASSSMK